MTFNAVEDCFITHIISGLLGFDPLVAVDLTNLKLNKLV